jgi:hypothetical protein
MASDALERAEATALRASECADGAHQRAMASIALACCSLRRGDILGARAFREMAHDEVMKLHQVLAEIELAQLDVEIARISERWDVVRGLCDEIIRATENAGYVRLEAEAHLELSKAFAALGDKKSAREEAVRARLRSGQMVIGSGAPKTSPEGYEDVLIQQEADDILNSL